MLQRTDLQQFYDAGYLIVRNAIPDELVDEARRLADSDTSTPSGRDKQQAAFAALFNDPACKLKPAAQQLATGDPSGEIFKPIVGGQNAKRSPELVTDRKEESGYPRDQVQRTALV